MDNVADKMEDIEVDKVDAKEADMVVKIPNEDFFDVTLAIGDSYGDKGGGQGCTTCVTFSQPELTQNHFHYKSAMIKQFAKNLTFCDKKWQSLNGFLSL